MTQVQCGECFLWFIPAVGDDTEGHWVCNECLDPTKGRKKCNGCGNLHWVSNKRQFNRDRDGQKAWFHCWDIHEPCIDDAEVVVQSRYSLSMGGSKIVRPATAINIEDTVSIPHNYLTYARPKIMKAKGETMPTGAADWDAKVVGKERSGKHGGRLPRKFVHLVNDSSLAKEGLWILETELEYVQGVVDKESQQRLELAKAVQEASESNVELAMWARTTRARNVKQAHRRDARADVEMFRMRGALDSWSAAAKKVIVDLQRQGAGGIVGYIESDTFAYYKTLLQQLGRTVKDRDDITFLLICISYASSKDLHDQLWNYVLALARYQGKSDEAIDKCVRAAAKSKWRNILDAEVSRLGKYLVTAQPEANPAAASAPRDSRALERLAAIDAIAKLSEHPQNVRITLWDFSQNGTSNGLQAKISRRLENKSLTASDRTHVLLFRTYDEDLQLRIRHYLRTQALFAQEKYQNTNLDKEPWEYEQTALAQARGAKKLDRTPLYTETEIALIAHTAFLKARQREEAAIAAFMSQQQIAKLADLINTAQIGRRPTPGAGEKYKTIADYATRLPTVSIVQAKRIFQKLGKQVAAIIGEPFDETDIAALIDREKQLNDVYAEIEHQRLSHLFGKEASNLSPLWNRPKTQIFLEHSRIGRALDKVIGEREEQDQFIVGPRIDTSRAAEARVDAAAAAEDAAAAAAAAAAAGDQQPAPISPGQVSSGGDLSEAVDTDNDSVGSVGSLRYASPQAQSGSGDDSDDGTRRAKRKTPYPTPPSSASVVSSPGWGSERGTPPRFGERSSPHGTFRSPTTPPSHERNKAGTSQQHHSHSRTGTPKKGRWGGTPPPQNRVYHESLRCARKFSALDLNF